MSERGVIPVPSVKKKKEFFIAQRYVFSIKKFPSIVLDGNVKQSEGFAAAF